MAVPAVTVLQLILLGVLQLQQVKIFQAHTGTAVAVAVVLDRTLLTLAVTVAEAQVGLRQLVLLDQPTQAEAQVVELAMRILEHNTQELLAVQVLSLSDI
jgi:hypothetical protein